MIHSNVTLYRWNPKSSHLRFTWHISCQAIWCHNNTQMNGCHSVASARTCRIRFRNIVISHPLACQGISYTLNPFKRISFCMHACSLWTRGAGTHVIHEPLQRLISSLPTRHWGYHTKPEFLYLQFVILYKYILKLQIPFISGSNLKILYQFKLQSSLLKHLQWRCQPFKNIIVFCR